MMRKSPISLLAIFVWLVGALFFLYEFFLRTFVGSLAHQVIPDLHLNAETFALLGSAYYLAYGLMQVPVGILADKFGVKKIMVFATLTCALATFLFANAQSFVSAFASRFFMGLGSSFAFVCLLVIAMTWFPRKYFGFFAGVSQFFGTMGPFLAGGPLIAFMHKAHEGWRAALSSVGAFGIVLAILVLVVVRTKPRDGEQSLVYLNVETPFKDRLIRLVKNKQAWVIALYSASSYVSIALLAAVWGTAFLEARGLSQLAAADMISIAWLGYAIACPVLGALSDYTKRRKPILASCGVTGFISTILIVYMPTVPVWGYMLLFAGLGIAASGQNIGFATISEQVDLDSRATALGLNNGTITLLSAILPPAVSYFIFQAAGSSDAHLVPSDFLLGLSVMPILYLCSIILAVFFVRETFCKPQKEAIMLNVE